MTARQDKEGKAVTALRTALHAGGYSSIALLNWDTPELPERDRGKVPIAKGWQKTNGVPRFDARAANTGVLTGTVYPADLDVDDDEAVAQLVTIAMRIWGPVPTWRSRENSPRVLLPYRVETPHRKRVVHLSVGRVEFLGVGQQAAVYGRHYTGAPLVWSKGGLAKIPLHQLPVVTDAQIDAFEREATKLYPPEKKQANGDARSNRGKADFRNTKIRSDVESALTRLPCDYDRPAWVKLGMAFREGGGRYETFLRWSKTHPDYKDDGGTTYVRRAWNSFANPREVTVASLFDETFRRYPGWRKPSERDPDYVEPEETVEDDDDEFGEGATSGADRDPFAGTEALPLCPEPRVAEPYPLTALGPLQAVVEGISETVGCEPGLAAQSVLMAAALGVAGVANIHLPKIGIVGLALFFVTIARSSERKSSADKRATRGVKDRVKELVEEHKLQAQRQKNEVAVYTAARNAIVKDRKLSRKTQLDQLQALGPEPAPLLHPVLASADITTEGILKEWARKTFRPVQALMTSEGGLFVSGAAMSKDMRMRTVATLCALWDCDTITKVRAGDGVMIVGETRLVVHLLFQPNFVPELLGDPILRQQGFLSRLLIAWPRSRIGYRDKVDDGDDESTVTPAEEEFRHRIHKLVSRYASSELDLEILRVDSEAGKLWSAYSNEIERAQRPDAPYAELSDVAGKSAEQAGRLAGILTLYGKPGATIVTANVMRNAITLARWYLGEALRIEETGVLRPEIADAIKVLKWLREHPQHRTKQSLLQNVIPSRLQEKAKLDPILRILVEHNLVLMPKRKPIIVREADEK